ncbi:MAG: FitA-like ribbon-helix-helix domain-containing protein, partial [Gammaproteobacteria bacterium]
MKSLTLKNIPDLLYVRIKKQAAEHHRSLNQEVITCLEQMTASVPMD